MALTLRVSGESLSDCLAQETCTLQPGTRYELGQDVIRSKASTIEVAPGAGAAVIDGSTRLDLHWEKCTTKKGKKHPDCGAGVYVATLDSKIPYQLFLGGNDVETRSLLLPARWPNLPKKPSHYPEDAPNWSPAFDGRKSWSIVKTGEDKCAGPHADKTCKSKRLSSMDRGIIDDDGDAQGRTETGQTEEGDPINIVTNGPGALAKQKFSAKGATLLISFGKRLVEVGKVENHTEGESTFKYHMPDCATSLYTSCGKKAKFMDVKYYLENTVALIDQRHEYALEVDADDVSSKLYMKFDEDKDLENVAGKLVTKRAMWARLKGSPDFAFDLAGITSAKVKGVTFFATSPLVSKRQDKVTLDGNTFLYPFASKRVAKVFSQPPLLTVLGDNSNIVNNVFRYGEGVVLTAGGKFSVLKNNLFEWNGFLSTNGPQTIIYGQGRIIRNTLRWNGQVSGFKLLGKSVNVQFNEVEHQNYGELLHDGAAFHVQTKAQDGTFSHNWIHDGHQSMGIRFDTASTTPMANIGRDGTLTNNVMWNTGMVLKGDEHRVERNTVFDASVMLVRAFGEQQGMNEDTEMKDNLMSVAPVPRGKKWSGAWEEVKRGNKIIRMRTPKGLEVTLSGVSTDADCSWLSLSGKWGWLANDGFASDATMAVSPAVPKQAELREVVEPNGDRHDWDELGDTYKKRTALCKVLAQEDVTLKFRTERRPKGPAWKLAQVPEKDNDITGACEKVRSCTLHDFRPRAASQTKGAYSSQDMKKTWIPGQQTSVPRQSSPTAGATAVPAESSLIFLQARDCESHTIELVEDAPGAAVEAESFTGGENVWEAPGLVTNKKYKWRIQSRCEEKGFSGWQTFDTIPKPAGDNDDDDDDDDNGNDKDGSEAKIEAELVKEMVQCKGPSIKKQWLGYHDSLKACAAIVHKAGAKYFAAEEKTTGKRKGKWSCMLQGTNDAGCEEFKARAKWNYYKVKVPCEDTKPWCPRRVAHCTKSSPKALMTQRKCPKTCDKCPTLLATSATSSSQPIKRRRFLQGLALIQQKKSMARKVHITDEL